MANNEKLSDIKSSKLQHFPDLICPVNHQKQDTEQLSSKSVYKKPVTLINPKILVEDPFTGNLYLKMKSDKSAEALRSLKSPNSKTTMLTNKAILPSSPQKSHTPMLSTPDTICFNNSNKNNNNNISNKMYVNPKFLKTGSNFPSHSVTSMESKKPTVHVNPKVLAQFMEINSHSGVSPARYKSFDESLPKAKRTQTLITMSKPHKNVTGNVTSTNPYLYCTKTKLVKCNLPLQHCGVDVANSQSVPKRTSSTVSSSGALMSLSRTKLVRTEIKTKKNSSQISELQTLSLVNKNSRLKVARRSYVNSTLVSANKLKLIRVPGKQRTSEKETYNFSTKSLNSQSYSSKLKSVLNPSSESPMISLSKTKLVRSPCKQRRTSVLSNRCEPQTFVSVSRTKLIRSPVKPRVGVLSNMSESVSNVRTCNEKGKISSNPTVLCSKVRKFGAKGSTMTVKAAKAVRSKYKIIKPPVTRPRQNYFLNKTSVNQEEKYKLDRRLNKLPKRVKNVKKYSLHYNVPKQTPLKSYRKNTSTRYSSSQVKFGNRSWIKSLTPRKVLIKNKKLLKIGSSPIAGSNKARRNLQQNLCLVQIGGVLYKTSKTKLTRSNTPKSKPQTKKALVKSDKELKIRNSFIVSVRGNKFFMDRSGKSLIKVPERETSNKENNCSPVKRIDIGGVTFIQKSKNVLVRTNTHNARSVVSQAKQRSIAMLTNKLRKSNLPCMFYHRFGKCTKMEKGSCPYLHDRKQVAICKRFLQGCCELSNCTLSHDVVPEKMPTCKYFLEGCCVRDNCPYLHVKVNEKAEICKSFLGGYCADGKKCRKRHTYICPEFHKTGNCPKGKYCKYPHQAIVNKKKAKKHTVKKEHKAPVTSEPKRYYETETTSVLQESVENAVQNSQGVGSDIEAKRAKLMKKVNDMKRNWLIAVSGTDVGLENFSELKTENNDESVLKRPKIGTLPSYIPLSPNSQ